MHFMQINKSIASPHNGMRFSRFSRDLLSENCASFSCLSLSDVVIAHLTCISDHLFEFIIIKFFFFLLFTVVTFVLDLGNFKIGFQLVFYLCGCGLPQMSTNLFTLCRQLRRTRFYFLLFL